MDEARDLKFDGLKFLLIFCVVFGHLGCYDYGLRINRMIYSFHMPVFVFLSGYFTSLSSNSEKQNNWLKKTLIIYAVAQITHYFLRVLLEFGASTIKAKPFDYSLLSWKFLVSPELALWYLVCLIYWRIAIWRVFNKFDDYYLLICSLFLMLISGLIPIDHAFAFQRAFSFFPFFALGIVFKKRHLLEQLEHIPIWGAAIALIIGLIIARYMPSYMPKFHYANWQQAILRVIQTGLGICLCLLVVRVSRIKAVELFARYGQHTLWIYIGHTYLITIGQKVFHYLGVPINILTALFLSIMYCAILILLAEMIKQRKQKVVRV